MLKEVAAPFDFVSLHSSAPPGHVREEGDEGGDVPGDDGGDADDGGGLRGDARPAPAAPARPHGQARHDRVQRALLSDILRYGLLSLSPHGRTATSRAWPAPCTWRTPCASSQRRRTCSWLLWSLDRQLVLRCDRPRRASPAPLSTSSRPTATRSEARSFPRRWTAPRSQARRWASPPPAPGFPRRRPLPPAKKGRSGSSSSTRASTPRPARGRGPGLDGRRPVRLRELNAAGPFERKVSWREGTSELREGALRFQARAHSLTVVEILQR